MGGHRDTLELVFSSSAFLNVNFPPSHRGTIGRLLLKIFFSGSALSHITCVLEGCGFSSQ